MKKIYKYLSMLLMVLICSIFLSMSVKADAIRTVQITGIREYDTAKEICDIVNAERAKKGRSPVKLDMQLTEAAMKRAEESAIDYSHIRPSGKSCWSVSDIAMAENTAMDFVSASDVMNAWMSSSGTRASILSRNYSGIGVGVFTDGYHKFYVQIFTSYPTTEEATFVGKRLVKAKIRTLESNLKLNFDWSKSNLEEGQEVRLSLYHMAKEDMSNFLFCYTELDSVGVKWTVSDPTVLSVNNGKVTAKKAGTATVSARIGKKSTSITITVQHVWDSKHTVIKEATCEKAGEKAILCKICGAKNTASKTIIPAKLHQWGSWKVVKEATVLKHGIRERVCQECQHHEKESTKKVTPTGKLNMTEIYLKVNQVSKALEVTEMKQEDGIASYTSSNKKIFTVDKYGKITGKGKGSATLKVTLKSGKKLYAKVYVQAGTVKTTKLTVNEKVVTLKEGETFTLQAVVAPLTSQQKVTFTTTKKPVAIVNENGKITAKKQGTAYIVVRSGTKKVTVKVIVE